MLKKNRIIISLLTNVASFVVVDIFLLAIALLLSQWVLLIFPPQLFRLPFKCILRFCLFAKPFEHVGQFKRFRPVCFKFMCS